MKKKPRTTKPARVTKIVKEHAFKNGKPHEIEKAQIELHDGDNLYREIRIENALEEHGTGKKVKLKEGADVEVTIEADEKETTD